jgi:Prokaryotic homologs of the JAB domain
MTSPLWRAWIAEDAAAAIARAARSAHPRETGGVLVGVLTHGSRPWVTQAVELRSAKATGTSYEVPAGARRKAIARLRRDDARLGYLGEWHVHPADVEPSAVDTATITRLAEDPDSGCDRPLLLVARRTPSGYTLDGRQLASGKLRELRMIATGLLTAPEVSTRASKKPRSGSPLLLSIGRTL